MYHHTRVFCINLIWCKMEDIPKRSVYTQTYTHTLANTHKYATDTNTYTHLIVCPFFLSNFWKTLFSTGGFHLISKRWLKK